MLGPRVLSSLMSAGMWLLAAAQPAPQTARPTPPAPTPTVDRLAAPPTVASPTQADRGAQVFWLNCQPCHGDRGQGLTDEWRAQYPAEDQNCWDSGCHGKTPYDNGFKLPDSVPAVIGSQALSRFDTAQSLHQYISTRMPFQAPATLSDEEYWQLTAYLLRSNGFADGSAELDSALAPALYLRTPAATPTATAHPAPGIPGLTADRAHQAVWAAGGAALIALSVILWRRLQRRRPL